MDNDDGNDDFLYGNPQNLLFTFTIFGELPKPDKVIRPKPDLKVIHCEKPKKAKVFWSDYECLPEEATHVVLLYGEEMFSFHPNEFYAHLTARRICEVEENILAAVVVPVEQTED